MKNIRGMKYVKFVFEFKKIKNYFIKNIVFTPFVLSEIATRFCIEGLKLLNPHPFDTFCFAKHLGRTDLFKVSFKVQVWIGILIFYVGTTQPNFLQNALSQYRAHAAYQAQDFKTAQQEYTKLLQDNPYDPEKNYNLGVALYKDKRFEESEKYFDRAVAHAQPNSLLKKQALFNRANSLVQQNKLQEAMQDYKKVLQIDPKNEKAQKDLKIVEQMLKEPSQKKNQNKSDKNQQQSGSDESQSDGSQGDESLRDTSQQKKNQTQQQKNKNNGGSKDQQRDQQNQQEQKDQAEDKKADGLQKSKEQETNAGKQQAGKKAKDKQHASSLQKSDSKDSTKFGQLGKDEQKQQPALDDAFAQQMKSGVQNDDRLQKRSVVLLEKLDDYEKNIQKQLLQMNVTKQGAQQYGQKNW